MLGYKSRNFSTTYVSTAAKPYCANFLPFQYVKDWKSRFSVNQVIQGRIARYAPFFSKHGLRGAESSPSSSVSRENNRVELTLRSGDITKLSKTVLTLKDFEESQKVDGFVKKVETFGLFIEIEGTKVSGLCHKSEVGHLS
jgi:rRNA biogenesis protein RRP5